MFVEFGSCSLDQLKEREGDVCMCVVRRRGETRASAHA